MFFRLVFGGVTLAVPGLAIGHAHVRNLPAMTAPALRNLWNAAMPERFVFRTVACSIMDLAVRLGGVDNLSVNAAPTTTTGTMLECFFF